MKIFSKVKKYFSSSQGFSTVKLLIILTILGAMIFFIFRFFDPMAYIISANDAKRKSDLKKIQKALDSYYQTNRAYPPHYIDVDNDPPDLLLSYKIRNSGGVAQWGSDGFKPYIDFLPRDNNEKKRYVYFSSPSRQAYYLYASLDNLRDPGACNKGNACGTLSIYNIPENACDNSPEEKKYICNYAVTSSNVTP